MRDLPPIGSRVRLTNGDLGTVYDAYKRGQAVCVIPPKCDRFACKVHRYWVTADEIEEVLP